MLLSLALIGCQPNPQPTLSDACLDEPPVAGEVRAKQIVCDEELPEGSEAEVGDWLLENSLVRIIVRGATHRLTQLEGTGGTILDVSLPNEADAVTEIYPNFEQGWPESAIVSSTEDSIRVEATDGSALSWEYQLAPDQSVLTVENATGFTLVPPHGAYRTGHVVQSPHSPRISFGATGNIIDEGGWVQWEGTNQLGIGALQDVVNGIHPDSLTASGETDGSALQVAGENFSYAFWSEESSFSIQVPPGTEVRALQSGFEPSEWATPSNNMSLSVGEDGFINASIVGEEGQPIATSVVWNDRQYNLPPGTHSIPVGPGEGSGWIDAGPKYKIKNIEAQTISGTVNLDVQLETGVQGDALIAIDVPAFPDRHERRFTDDVLVELAAKGTDYVIFSASDEVAQATASDNLAVNISSHAGSRAESDIGQPMAFPWSNNRREPAHGAAPWADLSPLDLLAFMSKAGRRTTIVDREWVEAAGNPVEWDPIPDWFIIREFDDVWSYITLLDQWIAAPVLGETTWVMTKERNRTGILRAVTEGKTIATTGPHITFSIDGKGPGSNLHNEFNDIEFAPTIEVEVENLGDIEWITMLGSGGTELVSWKPHSPSTHYPISDSSWVIVVAKGETDWAITSPIWLKRP